MGGAAPLCRALIALSVVLIGAESLRQIGSGVDCSQPPTLQCTIKNSSCLDFSWLRSYNWTPNAPSHMEVASGIGQNELGLRVPILRINWTVSIDSSIKELQGVKISVLELSTQMERCVQFQFSAFPSQRHPNGQPWRFHYDGFEVNPGHEYYVTVQHLPREREVNVKWQKVSVPRCNEGDMGQTDTCCKLGVCWFPNIGIKHQGENLTVEFSTRRDAQRYGVQVKVGDLPGTAFQEVQIQQGSPVQRVQITFPHIGGYVDKECVYNISVWPYMPSCPHDCVRLYYVPPCATETPPPPEPVERLYLWSVAALLTVLMFGGIILALCHNDCFSDPEKDPLPSFDDPIPPPTKKKVWLVYSADHGHYVNVVIKLADFMQLAWGLDVVLDRLHLQEMGMIGPMAWLDRQKDEIDRSNGTILILCSRGVQEKWKAMQSVEEERVTLREDREHPIEDLFTPALSLILPDFQQALPYDRYVVAYFSSISTLADVPSLLKVCPTYSLTEKLEEIFFRIQRREQHQPHVQLTVSYEDHPSYRRLVKAMERCRMWQECNLGWFENECTKIPVEDLEGAEEEGDVYECATRRLYPVIQCPETSASLVEPLLLNPDPATVLDPTIAIGTPFTQVEPFLSEAGLSVPSVQPLLHEVTSAAVSVQEPRLVGEDPSLGGLGNGLLRQDVSIQPGPGILSIEQLREAQKMFFQNFLDSPDMSSNMEVMSSPGQDSVDVAGHQPVRVDEQFHEHLLEVMSSPGQYSVEIAGHQPVRVGEQFHEHLLTPAVDPGTGLPDRHSVQLADQGYSTWNPYEMDLKAIQMESLKLFMQNEGRFLNFEQV